MKFFKEWIFNIQRLMDTSLSLLNLILFSCSLIVLSRIGIPNANVFPVPVLARAIKSCPFSAGSSTALWKWEGNNSEFENKSIKENLHWNTTRTPCYMKCIWIELIIHIEKIRWSKKNVSKEYRQYRNPKRMLAKITHC